MWYHEEPLAEPVLVDLPDIQYIDLDRLWKCIRLLNRIGRDENLNIRGLMSLNLKC